MSARRNKLPEYWSELQCAAHRFLHNGRQYISNKSLTTAQNRRLARSPNTTSSHHYSLYLNSVLAGSLDCTSHRQIFEVAPGMFFLINLQLVISACLRVDVSSTDTFMAFIATAYECTTDHLIANYEYCLLAYQPRIQPLRATNYQTFYKVHTRFLAIADYANATILHITVRAIYRAQLKETWCGEVRLLRPLRKWAT